MLPKVYIKDFKMPKSCAECPLKYTLTVKRVSWCEPTGRYISLKDQNTRAGFCPLRETT